jgi:hypothetical protein
MCQGLARPDRSPASHWGFEMTSLLERTGKGAEMRLSPTRHLNFWRRVEIFSHASTMGARRDAHPVLPFESSLEGEPSEQYARGNQRSVRQPGVLPDFIHQLILSLFCYQRRPRSQLCDPSVFHPQSREYRLSRIGAEVLNHARFDDSGAPLRRELNKRWKLSFVCDTSFQAVKKIHVDSDVGHIE